MCFGLHWKNDFLKFNFYKVFMFCLSLLVFFWQTMNPLYYSSVFSICKYIDVQYRCKDTVYRYRYLTLMSWLPFIHFLCGIVKWESVDRGEYLIFTLVTGFWILWMLLFVCVGVCVNCVWEDVVIEPLIYVVPWIIRDLCSSWIPVLAMQWFRARCACFCVWASTCAHSFSCFDKNNK